VGLNMVQLGCDLAGATASSSAHAREAAAAFRGRGVGRGAYVALSIAGFVRLEVGERLRPAIRQRAAVTVARVVAVVDVAVEAARAMEPGSRADEDAADEPVGAVVAIGSAVIRRVIEVTVGAYWRYSDADHNLGGGNGYGRQQRCSGDGNDNERFEKAHEVLLKIRSVRCAARPESWLQPMENEGFGSYRQLIPAKAAIIVTRGWRGPTKSPYYDGLQFQLSAIGSSCDVLGFCRLSGRSHYRSEKAAI
jgi:hypothetical protein